MASDRPPGWADSMLETVRRALPLRVTGVVVNEPNVVLVGENWSMSLLCDWSLRLASATLSSETASANEVLRGMTELIGRSMVAIAALDEDVTDPVLTFTDDAQLALVADCDLDPWALHLPDVVLVGHTASNAGRT